MWIGFSESETKTKQIVQKCMFFFVVIVSFCLQTHIKWAAANMLKVQINSIYFISTVTELRHSAFGTRNRMQCNGKHICCSRHLSCSNRKILQVSQWYTLYNKNDKDNKCNISRNDKSITNLSCECDQMRLTKEANTSSSSSNENEFLFFWFSHLVRFVHSDIWVVCSVGRFAGQSFEQWKNSIDLPVFE